MTDWYVGVYGWCDICHLCTSLYADTSGIALCQTCINKDRIQHELDMKEL